jgi:hypothetical protein
MDETKLREQLDRLADEAVAPESAGRRTLARARRRRALTVGATSVVVIALVVAGLTGVRAVLDESVTIGNEPSPTIPPAVDPAVFPGMWPETDVEALAEVQAQVDAGHVPERSDPVQTGRQFATSILGWPPGVPVTSHQIVEGRAIVELRNETLPNSASVVLELRQLGATGNHGVWTLVGATTPAIQLDAVPALDRTISELHLTGSVQDPFVGVPRVSILEGPAADDVNYRGFVGPAESSDPFLPPTNFRAAISNVPPTPNGRAMVLIWMPSMAGANLGAVAFPILTRVAEPEPAIHLEGAPPDVAVTAQRILDGALAHDLDALAELIDPNTFVFDFDDGSDPIPAWREDPSVLDAIPGVLRLPFVIKDIEGYGTFYVWPYLAKDGALDDVTDQERADLHSLGFSNGEIEQMRELGSYLGPRLAIDTNGVWRNYVTGGD